MTCASATIVADCRVANYTHVECNLTNTIHIYPPQYYVLEAVSTGVPLADTQIQSAAAVAVRKLGYDAMKDKQRDYVL